jgi:AraC-like DNA-binding protein
MEQFRCEGRQELSGSAHECPQLREQWLSFMAQNICIYKLEAEVGEVSGFRMSARSRSIGGFTIARFVTTAGRSRLLRDTAEIARDSRDPFALFVALRGAKYLSQFGRSQQIRPGSYSLLCASEPTVQEKRQSGTSDTVCFVMPREFIDRRIVNGEGLCLRPYEAGKGLHHLAFETVVAFQKDAWEMANEEFERSARLLGELVLLATGGPVDVISNERSVRASNLARAKRIMRQRLSDSTLSLADVAQQMGLTLNYLHKLFRDDGRTMWEYLKAERLQRARELLDLASVRNVTITDVSLQCGFADTAHFSKSFKRVFGVSPREARRNH